VGDSDSVTKRAEGGILESTMPNARIPQIDISDNSLLALADGLGELAEKRCSSPDDFETFSRSAMEVIADAMWIVEHRKLEAACTTDEVIEVGGEPYRKLSQPSSRIYSGLWGAHLINEPLYRRLDVHNGPTLKPLDLRLGVIEHSMLPNLARIAGDLMTTLTSRQTEQKLQRLGFRPPSRAVLEKRVGQMYEDMAVGARELEDHCRETEQLDFEPVAISCGLDRFNVRMDEVLPEGPLRTEKLKKRRPAEEYQRTPPEPHVTAWRLAWAGNVTLYDSDGNARKTFRYGTSADDDVTKLVARMVDDILAITTTSEGVSVCCIQDGAADLAPLRRELDQRLSPDTQRRDLVDFHHAIAYLDAIVSAKEDGDPDNMAGWYRLKLLLDDGGASQIVEHLRRERDQHRDAGNEGVIAAVRTALTYFEKRRPQMAYAEARAAHQPVGSGATESTCALFQLRVKHPGSHWGIPGLRGVMTAWGLELSDRWDTAFDAHRANLQEEILAA
jgi:hypothetical protein